MSLSFLPWFPDANLIGQLANNIGMHFDDLAPQSETDSAIKDDMDNEIEGLKRRLNLGSQTEPPKQQKMY